MTLLAHYPLNENAADTAVTDASGNGHGGTAARNTNLFSAVGKIGTALNFNGSSDLVSLGDFDILGAFTIAAWINTDTISTSTGGRPILAKWDNVTGNRSLLFVICSTGGGGDGGIGIARSSGGTDLKSHYTSGVVLASTGVWYHLVATYDGAGSVPLCYVNGELVALPGLTTSGSTGSGQYNNATALRIGSVVNNSSAPRWFDGCIDDLRIYDEVLPQWKIQSIYNYGRGTSRYDPWRKTIGGLQGRLRRTG
jgi:hypothetical protein